MFAVVDWMHHRSTTNYLIRLLKLYSCRILSLNLLFPFISCSVEFDLINLLEYGSHEYAVGYKVHCNEAYYKEGLV